ncbi:phage portal protein [Fodinicurvata fenggangensis]|uniref:phage portal protein n=1 Tax=Fodinicurvata fenggangensis TaxID=1121830 RepID=UPI000691B344|nr:phage portal protein [Fodinicurvata fenggangensis]
MAAAQKSSILDKTGHPYALPDAKSKARGMAAYDAGDPFSQELMTWDPPTMSADSAYLPERERIAARLHDLVRNDGWASGTVTSFVNAAIGSQFRLNSRPDYRALGISFEAARQLGKEIEAQWRQFANDPRCYADASRRTTVTGLFYQGFRHRIIDGETLMVPGYKPRPGWGWTTNFRLVHPERLSNPNHAPDTAYLRGGVELDDDGAAVAYHFRKAHPGDWHMMASEFYAWERVPRETAWGRPQVIHYFLPTEAEETRGISPLAPVVRRMKMNQKYESAELQAAVANAVLAAYIETSLPPEAAADLLSGQNEWENHNERRMDFYEEAPVKLNGMRIPSCQAATGSKCPWRPGRTGRQRTS